jgi:hypothetical protein
MDPTKFKLTISKQRDGSLSITHIPDNPHIQFS